jgi:hypothetical protein
MATRKVTMSGLELATRNGRLRPRGAGVCVPLEIERPLGAAAPVGFGVCLPQGRLREVGGGRLGEGGEPVSVQLETLGRWTDGSVRWLHVDGVLPAGAAGRSDWELELGAEEAATRGIAVSETPASVVVDCGPARFTIDRQTGRWSGPGGETVDLVLTTNRGRRLRGTVDEVCVEARGPVRACVRIAGRFVKAGLRYQVRLSFFAGTGLVQAETRLHNPRPARHPGGLWDLGDAGSALFRDLSLEATLPTGEHHVSFKCDAASREPAEELSGGRLEIYQESSGGENWRSAAHVNREGVVPLRFRGYRVEGFESGATLRVAGSNLRHGVWRHTRAEPVVTVEGRQGAVAVAVAEFWQQFPKAVEVERDRLSVRLFPGQFGDLFELQGGERKTHRVWFSFQRTDEGPQPLEWVYRPATVRIAPEWCDEAGVMPKLSAPENAAAERLDSLLGEAIGGRRVARQSREGG